MMEYVINNIVCGCVCTMPDNWQFEEGSWWSVDFRVAYFQTNPGRTTWREIPFVFFSHLYLAGAYGIVWQLGSDLFLPNWDGFYQTCSQFVGSHWNMNYFSVFSLLVTFLWSVACWEFQQGQGLALPDLFDLAVAFLSCEIFAQITCGLWSRYIMIHLYSLYSWGL